MERKTIIILQMKAFSDLFTCVLFGCRKRKPKRTHFCWKSQKMIQMLHHKLGYLFQNCKDYLCVCGNVWFFDRKNKNTGIDLLQIFSSNSVVVKLQGLCVKAAHSHFSFFWAELMCYSRCVCVCVFMLIIYICMYMHICACFMKHANIASLNGQIWM